MPNLKFPLLIFGTTITLGGGALLAQNLFSQGQVSSSVSEDSVESKLFKSRGYGKRFLNSSIDTISSAYWRKNGDKYKQDNKGRKNGEDSFNLKNGESLISLGDQEVSNIPPEFKDACFKRTSQKSLEDEDLSDDVIKYCTRNIIISDLVKEHKRVPLNLGSHEGTSSGRNAGNSYKLDNNELSGINAGNISSLNHKTNKKDENAPEDFRNKCINNLDSEEISNDVLVDQVKRGCTREMILGESF